MQPHLPPGVASVFTGFEGQRAGEQGVGHSSGELAAEVGRDLVLEKQLVGAYPMFGARVPHHEVRVVARRDTALALTQASESGGAAAHPLGELFEAGSAP